MDAALHVREYGAPTSRLEEGELEELERVKRVLKAKFGWELTGSEGLVMREAQKWDMDWYGRVGDKYDWRMCDMKDDGIFVNGCVEEPMEWVVLDHFGKCGERSMTGCLGARFEKQIEDGKSGEREGEASHVHVLFAGSWQTRALADLPWENRCPSDEWMFK